MNKADRLVLHNINRILNYGYDTSGENIRAYYKDGTPAHTKFITGVFEEYDIEHGEMPITSLRPIAWKSGIKETMWVFQDQSSCLNLLKNKYGVTWWNLWDLGDRSIGTAYGWIVKNYDLMNNLLEGLKNNPYGRRHIMNLYQYEHLDTGGLYPCAYETIWTVRGDVLDMTLIQRSSDYLVANHINKVQYVALMMMVARHCGYKVGVFRHFVQNMHIYDRHMEQAITMASRDSLIDPQKPMLVLDTDKTNFYDFTIDDFKMVDYKPVKPQLKFELAV